MKKRLLLVLTFFGILVAIRFSGLHNYINLEVLKENRAYLQQLVEHNYIFAALGYIIIYIIFAALSLPLAGILTIAGGFLFGTFFGTIYTAIGSTIGATFAFLLVRYVIGDYLQKRYKTQHAGFNKAVNEQGAYYLLSIRLLVIVPFFVANILCGLTATPVSTFFWTTAVGMLPAIAVFSFAGQQLGTLESVRDVFSTPVIVAFGLLILLALLPVIVKKLRGK